MSGFRSIFKPCVHANDVTANNKKEKAGDSPPLSNFSALRPRADPDINDAGAPLRISSVSYRAWTVRFQGCAPPGICSTSSIPALQECVPVR